jgi:hypothetical protein
VDTSVHQWASDTEAWCCAALFGMNLVSGLEEVEGLFWKVTGFSVCGGLLIYSTLVLAHTVYPQSAHKQRTTDMAALQDLLTYNVNDIGDIVHALSVAQQRCVTVRPGHGPNLVFSSSAAIGAASSCTRSWSASCKNSLCSFRARCHLGR